MLSSFSSLLLATALFEVGSAQCPNEVAAHYSNLRTASANNTWFIVPVPKAACQQVLDATYGLSILGISLVVLADLPTEDDSLLPKGFPEDHHPVLVDASYQDDIRMGPAKIQGALLGAGLHIPYVHRATIIGGNPNTVVQAPITAYISGPNGNAVAGLVPAVVSTLVEGYFLRLALLKPNNAAFQRNDNNILSNNAAWLVASNPVSGPGVSPTAYDMQFMKQDKFTIYTAKFLKTVINQPSMLQGGYFLANICQRNQYFYNNDTSTMTPVIGNVTFGPAADGLKVVRKSIIQQASPNGDGVYRGNEGFTGCGQNVGFNPESCDDAVKNVDQAVLE
ncbi:hypothetical protein LTR56_015734 [Elasticomyces elasticus]|nr:hypothetical protein LTR56_015734 [Elasticomyces elasticus]KAK3659235.1 hypothetical protein LTR22_008502 [Elasticomyces elasticus]KAK4914761.1 hypothetical protein LTR49_016996 [Elasticomyces elasticus]KAK5754231.1 hypothetical protein LTS12_015641 [Elasticomyces elasticus]